jgi:uncharacterized membrane protein
MKATTNPTTIATRRYVIELTASMVVYMAVLFGTRWAFRDYHGPWLPVIALVPAIPVLFVFAAGLRLFRRTDELTQRVMTESLAMAGVVTALLSATYGFLEIDVLPRPSAWWVWSAFMASWAIASIVLRRRYQ